MPLTPQAVQDQKFTSIRWRRAYDEDEVDAFLDVVEAELSSRDKQLADLAAELAALRTELATGRSAAVSARRAPAARLPEPAPEWELASLPGSALARRAEDEPVSRAGVEAYANGGPPQPPSPLEDALRRTLVLAQLTAAAVLAEAREEAAQLIAHATHDAREAARIAERDHGHRLRARQLEAAESVAQVERLRGFEREYRGRLRAYLNLQVCELENAAPLEPAPRGRTGLAGPPGEDGEPDDEPGAVSSGFLGDVGR